MDTGWRLGRLLYFVLVLVNACVAAGIAIAIGGKDQLTVQLISTGVSLPGVIIFVRARLRDMQEETDKWWHILIPFYNIIFGFRLLFTAAPPREWAT